MTEQFRKVEALIIDRHYSGDPYAENDDDTQTVLVGVDDLTVPEARALRDWLNRVLPEEKM